jgi:hypothetical protein
MMTGKLNQWLILAALSALVGCSFLFSMPLSITLVVVAACVILAIRNIDKAIMISLFLLLLLFRTCEIQYNDPQRDFNDIFKVASVVPLLITYCVWLIRRCAGLEESRLGQTRWLFIFMFFFLAWAVLSLVWSRNVIHGMNLLGTMLVNLVMIHMLVVYVRERRNVRRLFQAVCIIAFLLCLDVINSHFYVYENRIKLATNVDLVLNLGGEQTKNGGNQIRSGGFATSDQACLVINLLIFVCLPFVLSTRKWRYAFLLMLLLVCEILTGSKAGIASLFIGMFFVLLLHPLLRMKRTLWYAVMGCLLIVAILGAYFIFSEGRLIAPLLSAGGAKVAASSATGRLTLWAEGFRHFADVLLVGYGAGSSVLLAEIVALPHMHSLYFSALLDLGIPGFALLAGIILTVCWMLRRNLSLTRKDFVNNALWCLTGAFIAGSLQVATINEFDLQFFWLIVALIIATCTGKSLHDKARSRCANDCSEVDPLTDPVR